MYGYTERILRIDLTKRRAKTGRIEKEMILNYVGGKGFGAKILFEETEPLIDPFDSRNLLIFATGPVNGLSLSGAAKFTAVFKSPLTGIWGESQCGGYFSFQMKSAGYDILVVQGRSTKPVCLIIEDNNIKIEDAAHLWKKDTFETEETIKKEHGAEFQVLSIGPAGENLVRYACIAHDKGREFGRCGGGAVMGSKKLKAVAIAGHGKIEIAKPDELKEFARELNARIKERLKSLMEYGTSNIIATTNTTGTLPTRNWTDGKFEGFENINAESIKRKIMKSSKACFACAVACRKISKVENGPYVGTQVEGPEYETLYAFGSLCGNDNLESIAKANELCDRLGLDTISAGNTLAFAMECYEKGLITCNDTGGLALTFGNHEAIVALLEKIAHRDGFGNVLAEGVQRAAKKFGKNAEKHAVHVKGLEPPGYDPRGLKGVALAYSVSCRGACHLRHMAYRPNLTGTLPFRTGKVDRLSYEGQACMVKEQEDFYTLVDSMVLCKFLCLPTMGPILWKELVKLYQIVTGRAVGKKDLVDISSMITNRIIAYNEREGSGRKENVLPDRFMFESLKTGASQGEVIRTEEFEKMLREYYVLRD